MLEPPLWDLLLFSFASFVASHWILTIPAAVGLAVLGWRGGPRLKSFRWLAFGASAILAMPFVLAVLFALHDKIRAANAQAKFLRGWPCRWGSVAISSDRMWERCELASAHAFFDYELPVGTRLSYLSETDEWSFLIPEGKGLAIKALSATVPGAFSLEASGDGHLKGITSKGGQTIVVYGVVLGTMYVRFSGQAVFGKTSQSTVVAGEQQPAGTAVKIDLLTGAVSLAGPKWCLSE
ncbi:MAG: hypothetical protein HY852_00155 [Bradyrhizobium sp.]|uniref:hypothetical protein n=1 Tax=Bradyrhizobium sp. TaxID=376 RepID=UPI0025C050EF|nr:hypothetical protein [Bradyrhizobium sp.]MBI5260214.1 hypothetical protein [Bradyrhizobium sp.]